MMMVTIEEDPIKAFIIHEDRPPISLTFMSNVTVRKATSQVATVLDISERGSKNKVLRLKFGGTELRPDWFLYDCCLPVGATLRAVYVEEIKPSFIVQIPVLGDEIYTPSMLSITDTPIAKLRSVVSAESGLPVSMFRLLRSDKTVLYDDKLTQYYDLDQGDTLIAEVWEGWDVFLTATRQGYTEALIQLIEEDQSAMGNYRAKVALYIASHFGHVELASSLMKLGFPSWEPIGEHPYRKWCISDTLNPPHPDLFKAPIHVASDRGQLGILRAMIAFDQSALMAQVGNARPINFSLRKGHKKCQMLLITKTWSKIPYADGFITLRCIHNLKQRAAQARVSVYLCLGAMRSSLRRHPSQWSWAPLLAEGISVDSPKKNAHLNKMVPQLVSNNPKYASLPVVNVKHLPQMSRMPKIGEENQKRSPKTKATAESSKNANKAANSYKKVYFQGDDSQLKQEEMETEYLNAPRISTPVTSKVVVVGKQLQESHGEETHATESEGVPEETSLANYPKKRPLVKNLSTTIIRQVEEEQNRLRSRKHKQTIQASSRDGIISGSEHLSEELTSSDMNDSTFSSRLIRFQNSKSLFTKIPPRRLITLATIDSKTEDVLQTNEEAAESNDTNSNNEATEIQDTSPPSSQNTRSVESRQRDSRKLNVTKSVPLPMSEKTEKQTLSLEISLPQQTTPLTAADSQHVSSPSAAAASTGFPSYDAIATRHKSISHVQINKGVLAKEKALSELLTKNSKTLNFSISLPSDNVRQLPKPWINPSKIDTAEDPNVTIKLFQKRYRPNDTTRDAATKLLDRANQFSSMNFLKRVNLAIEMSQRQVKKALVGPDIH